MVKKNKKKKTWCEKTIRRKITRDDSTVENRFKLERESEVKRMARTSSSSPSSSSSTVKDAQDLLRALWSAYSATPTNLKVSFLFLFSFHFSINKSLLFPNLIFSLLSDHRSLCCLRCFHRTPSGSYFSPQFLLDLSFLFE
jgi:hypothetical protein